MVSDFAVSTEELAYRPACSLHRRASPKGLLYTPKATVQRTVHGHHDLLMVTVKKGRDRKRTHECIRVSCPPCV